MKYYLIAGEASGDLHASKLIDAIRQLDPDAQFRAWGGDLMKNAGATLVKHINETSIMGFAEVARHLPDIFRNIRYCKKDILNYGPDAVIFIDYPGFNLRIAPFVKKAGIKAYYYISPTVWAWKKSRIEIIRKNIEQLYVILPFEKEFYLKNGLEVTYYGNPLNDSMNDFRRKDKESYEEFILKNNLPHKPIIALLPGSRQQELMRLLPDMLKAANKFRNYTIVIAAAPGLKDEDYKKYNHNQAIHLLRGQTYALLKHAHAAVVTSGTATLETALIGTPQVVVYKTSPLSFFIARLLVHINFISLVNLIGGKEIVRELIQKNCNAQNISKALDEIISENGREQILADYRKLKEILGEKPVAEQIAKDLLKRIKSH